MPDPRTCLLVAALLASCTSAVDPGYDLGARAEPLAAADWSAARTLAPRYYATSVALLDGVAYAAVTNVGEVRLTRRAPNGAWTTPILVPGVTATAIRLTAFYGRLYLVSQPIGQTALALTRYEPSTDTWSSPSILPFQSHGVAGVTSHANQLVLMGSDPTSHVLWVASMDSQGTFQPAQATTLHGVDATVGSHAGQLHAAYNSWSDARGQAGADVLHASFDGVEWTEPEHVMTGFGSDVLRGQPALANYAGEGLDCLHLTSVEVDPQAALGTIWWTYACGQDAFAVPVSITSSGDRRIHSLAASASELVVAYPLWVPGSGYDTLTRSYHYPRVDGQPCNQSSDCQSGLCTSSFRDADGDGFGTGAPSTLCGAAPVGRATVAGDCCDADARARPGQTQYFTSPGACGGFDFDCSGSTTPLYPARSTAGCVSVGSCTLLSRACSGPYWSTAGSAPACGASASWRDCFVQPACRGGFAQECGAYFPSTRTQACR